MFIYDGLFFKLIQQKTANQSESTLNNTKQD